MDLLPLLGVLIVIVGFALKFDAILIVMVALIVTAFTGGLGLTSMLETLGTTFVNNRGMAIFYYYYVSNRNVRKKWLERVSSYVD